MKREVRSAKTKSTSKTSKIKVDFNTKAVEFLASRKGTVIQKGNLVNDLSKATKCSSRTAYRMVDTLMSTNKLSTINLIKIN